MSSSPPEIQSAQEFAYTVAREYWRKTKQESGVSWDFRRFRAPRQSLNKAQQDEAVKIGRNIRSLPPTQAGFQISRLYARRLPKQYRSSLGIYYTPIPLVNKMLSDATNFGIDFSTAKVIDTSSGGAAFLAPLCQLMFRRDIKDQTAAVADLGERLIGLELDPFGAWLSQFLVDCELAYLAPRAKKPPAFIRRGNALNCPQSFFDQFDYVVGNPPYGTAPRPLPDHLTDVASGRVNLYQVFLKLAFLLANSGGVVHQITPTGFIGGDYSRALRRWMEQVSTPIQFDFLSKRTGVFESVEQEMVISLFTKERSRRKVRCNSVTLIEGKISQESLGNHIYRRGNQWVLPRQAADAKVVEVFDRQLPTLRSFGYEVKTGYVVPHRHKTNIFNRKGKNRYPLIWSEAIQDGCFDPERAYSIGRARWMKNHSCPPPIDTPCVLIKRTSAKEQGQRLQAAAVSQSFIDEFGGFYAENHVNVLLPGDAALITEDVLVDLLHTETVNSLFRCINGTVTVSASELLRIPLPSISELIEFSGSLDVRIDSALTEQRARHAYKLDHG